MAKKFFKTTIIIMAAVMALALCVALFGAPAAVTDDFAYVADVYGGTEAADLWYYGRDALDVYGAKEVVDGWKSELDATKPIVIAVVDTGLTVNHEIFKDVLLKNSSGQVLGDNSTVPDSGGEVDIGDESSGKHGNHVAGVIAMLIHEFELENYIKIYPIKASVKKNVDGTQQEAFSIESVSEAIRRANSKVNADIINLSLGRSYADTTAWADNTQLQYTVNSAIESSFIVAAAGNNGKRASLPREDGAFYPAALDGVFGVMGYDKNGRLWNGSNYGTLYDIAAPSDTIYSAAGVYGASGYSNDDGTSMAAPFASFAAALLKLRLRLEGEECDPHILSRYMRSFAFDNVTYDGTQINLLDLKTLVTQDLADVEPNYNDPTGIAISHDAALGSGDYADCIYYSDPRSVPKISLIARLTPFGQTDPDLDSSIRWSLIDSDGNETPLGEGRSISFTPTVFGDSRIVAKLSYASAVRGEQKMHIEYLTFFAGNAKVTYEGDVRDLKNAPTSGVLYTGETTVFSFVGEPYMDPHVKIKWYVNGQFAAEGRTFAFKPEKAGNYVIGMQYGVSAPTLLPGVAFEAKVKPFILRPLDLSMLIVGCALALFAVVTVVIIALKRKNLKAEQN